jgi:hypothetical protein
MKDKERFAFGDEVIIKDMSCDSLLQLLPKGTRFFVSSYYDSSTHYVPITGVRNGMEKCFWLPDNAVERL